MKMKRMINYYLDQNSHLHHKLKWLAQKGGRAAKEDEEGEEEKGTGTSSTTFLFL